MTDDWPHIKARLERYLAEWPDCPLDLRADIRAALQRVEELELDLAARDVDCGCNARVLAAEKRVEELERLNAGWEYEVERCRAERDAAEAKVARLRELHEALLNTLAPSRSTWVQHVVRNARAAFAAAKGEK